MVETDLRGANLQEAVLTKAYAVRADLSGGCCARLAFWCWPRCAGGVCLRERIARRVRESVGIWGERGGGAGARSQAVPRCALRLPAAPGPAAAVRCAACAVSHAAHQRGHTLQARTSRMLWWTVWRLTAPTSRGPSW